MFTSLNILLGLVGNSLIAERDNGIPPESFTKRMNSALRFNSLVIAKTLFSNATNQQIPFESKTPGTMIGFMSRSEFSISL